MPFIRGRYHINAVAGEALEAAREAEAALLALQHDAQAADQDGADDFDDTGAGSRNGAASYAKGPIHRVEIETAEIAGPPGRRLVEPGGSVPAHSGRAERGFVARVHRAILPSDDAASNGSRRAGADNFARVASASQPETHVFAGHRDLVSFLRDEFAKDCAQ